MVEDSDEREPDSARIRLGPDGAAPDETVSVQISRDGSVAASTYITCEG